MHCGDAPLTPRILGPSPDRVQQPIVAGTRSRLSDYPATGVILYYSEDPNSPMGAMLCSGTLVAPDVVLAAAHCQERFDYLRGPDVRYYFSLSLDVSHYGPLVDALPEDAVRVAYFLPHPDYDPKHQNLGLGRAADLGLFFLSEPVAGVAPAQLAHHVVSQALVAGARVTIVGYGRRYTSALGGHDNGIKYQGESTIHRVGTYEMLVGASARDALKCHGDSGGPTYMQVPGPQGPCTMLVGITSRAQDGAGCMAGGVDTRVDAYATWIDQSLSWACQHRMRPTCMASP